MFRTPPPATAMLLADEHHLDLLATAGHRPASGRTNVANSRARVVTSRNLLIGLVILAGLAVPWSRAQLADAATQARGAIAAHEIAPLAKTPPAGHTGIIVPPANVRPATGPCPARTKAVAQTGGTAYKTALPTATPPEGHTGIIVPPAGARPATDPCPARAQAVAQAGGPADKTALPTATPPEGHTGIIVPLASALVARGPRPAPRRGGDN
jgi:hypothetical protein